MALKVDLTGGAVRVIGNREDVHTARLGNPGDQIIIYALGQYEADFVSHLDDVPEEVALDVTDLATGFLSFPLVIRHGTYRVRIVEPRRTILTVEVEAR